MFSFLFTGDAGKKDDMGGIFDTEEPDTCASQENSEGKFLSATR